MAKVSIADQKKINAGFVKATVKFQQRKPWSHELTGEIDSYTGWVRKSDFDDPDAPEGKSFFIYYFEGKKRTPSLLTPRQRFISMELIKEGE